MDAEHTMRLDTAGTMRAAVKRCTETADDRRTADSMMKIFEKVSKEVLVVKSEDGKIDHLNRL